LMSNHYHFVARELSMGTPMNVSKLTNRE
jgi:hypothetical protein